jgi:O-acetyl-ADP-ribose deacetylase (regulator of RNase III)
MNMLDETEGLRIGHVNLVPVFGDITELQADAMVQPSGTSPPGAPLQASPWVISANQKDGSIFKALSPHSPLQLGEVIITPAGTLNAKYLFSAVVIDWGHQHPSGQLIVEEVIVSTARKCVAIAVALGLKSLAFTPWGTRVQAIEASLVTAIMIQAIISEIKAGPGNLETIYLISREKEHYQWFVDRSIVFRIMFEQIDQVRDQINNLEIPKEARNHILNLLGSLEKNVVVYNEIVGGDKISTGDISESTAIAIGKKASGKVTGRGSQNES